VSDYTGNIKYAGFACYWEPAGSWLRAHGDCKSTSGGYFYTETMKTSGDKPVYRVRVIRLGTKYPVLGPFDMPNESQPSDDDVVRELKARA
jgi:hypothetical protein